MAFFSKDIGIDLGTVNTLVYVKGKGIVIREPSVVAVDIRTDEVLAVGNLAREMIGRTPGSIVALRPLTDGVIADFSITAEMLKHFIRNAVQSNLFSRPRVIICIPSGVTEVERRAVENAARQAGGGVVDLIGSMVIDIGGGTTDIAVISLGDIVISRSVRKAGDAFNAAILSYVKRKYNLLIGERSAEDLKISAGSAFPYHGEKPVAIKGRNLVDGLPKNVVISGAEVREALAEPLADIVEAVKQTLGETPPELSADILDHGIMLTGGGALLRGLDKLLSQETGMPVNVAEHPLDCVAEGTGRMLDISENSYWRVRS